MSDIFAKVNRGQPLRFRADTYNALIDAAIDYRKRSRSFGEAGRIAANDADTILVRNVSGEGRSLCDVLGVSDVIVSPSDSLNEFQNAVAFDCVTPDVSLHKGRFVVLAEPIPDGKIGRAWASGVCPVRIAVASESHTKADISDGVSDRLASGDEGAVEILWTGSGTGTKWSVVRFGGSASGIGMAEVQVAFMYGDGVSGYFVKDGVPYGDITPIAFPRDLRQSYWAGQTINGRTYTTIPGFIHRRNSNYDGTDEEQWITPPFFSQMRFRAVKFVCSGPVFVPISGQPRECEWQYAENADWGAIVEVTP